MKGFDCQGATVGDISFPFTDEVVAKATCLPVDGEHWFKICTLAGIDIPFLLKDVYKDKT